MTTTGVRFSSEVFNFLGQSTLPTWNLRDLISQVEWADYDRWEVTQVSLTMQQIRDQASAFPFWQHRKKTGRKSIPDRDILIGLLLKTFFNCDYRRTQGYMILFEEFFRFERIPHHTVLSRKNRSKRWHRILKRFHRFVLDKIPRRKSVMATDATGYSGRKIPWKDVDYGLRATQDWVKTHVCSDVDNFLILSYNMTESNVHDSQEFDRLWSNLPENVTPIRSLADSAYTGEDCLKVARGAGATPIHDIKSNAKHTSKPSTAYQKLVNFAIHWPNRFQELLKDRKMVETAFSMVEAHFGYRLKCRSRIGRWNEVQLKLNAHNLRLLTAMVYFSNL